MFKIQLFCLLNRTTGRCHWLLTAAHCDTHIQRPKSTEPTGRLTSWPVVLSHTIETMWPHPGVCRLRRHCCTAAKLLISWTVQELTFNPGRCTSQRPEKSELHLHKVLSSHPDVTQGSHMAPVPLGWLIHKTTRETNLIFSRSLAALCLHYTYPA